MKKKIMTALTGAMLVASVGLAAPITDLDKGQTAIGYNHYNLDDGDNIDNDSFYLENAVSDKFILGLERNSYSIPGYDTKSTDVYAHYKLDRNVHLIVGNRDYSDGPNKMFYGIGANTSLAPKLDGYASVTTNSMETDWQAGVAYNLSNQTALHLGYKSYKQDGFSTIDGLGFGASYKF